MSDNCTIYADKIDYDTVREVVKAMSPNPVKVIGSNNKWKQIKTRGRSEIVFASMEGKPGKFDDFSQLVLGTYAFFQHTESATPHIKDRVLSFISKCQFAIGVVADPAFDEDEKHFDMVFAIAKALDALIFNGSGMIDANGLMVLDSEGNSDLTPE